MYIWWVCICTHSYEKGKESQFLQVTCEEVIASAAIHTRACPGSSAIIRLSSNYERHWCFVCSPVAASCLRASRQYQDSAARKQKEQKQCRKEVWRQKAIIRLAREGGDVTLELSKPISLENGTWNVEEQAAGSGFFSGSSLTVRGTLSDGPVVLDAAMKAGLAPLNARTVITWEMCSAQSWILCSECTIMVVRVQKRMMHSKHGYHA
eukprot:1136622-Pelagomonas_calceolata.AAC.3